MHSCVQHVLTIWVTCWVSYKRHELLTFRKHRGSPTVFGGVGVTHLSRFLCCTFCFVFLRPVSFECSFVYSHNHVIFCFMTHHPIFNKINSTSTTSGIEAAYPFIAPENSLSYFCSVRVVQHLVFCVMYCKPLFCILFFFLLVLYYLSFIEFRLLLVSSTFLREWELYRMC